MSHCLNTVPPPPPVNNWELRLSIILPVRSGAMSGKGIIFNVGLHSIGSMFNKGINKMIDGFKIYLLISEQCSICLKIW